MSSHNQEAIAEIERNIDELYDEAIPNLTARMQVFECDNSHALAVQQKIDGTVFGIVLLPNQLVELKRVLAVADEQNKTKVLPS